VVAIGVAWLGHGLANATVHGHRRRRLRLRHDKLRVLSRDLIDHTGRVLAGSREVVSETDDDLRI
jgi:hypothetical protein